MLGNPLSQQKSGETGLAYFGAAIPKFINLGFIFCSVIFIFMLIMGAIKWMSSGGDKGQLEGARSQVTNAIIGLFVLFAIYAVIAVITKFFNSTSYMNFTISPLIK